MRITTKTAITRLEVIAFVVGMAVLTFEFTAARIVAPYLGDTVYTWTSIIGVILAALAFGYYKGGIWADTRHRDSDVILCLLGAAGLIALVNIFKDVALESLSSKTMPLQLQAFIASVVLFALPTFMLGVLSPYLARLSISNVSTSGRHISRISAAGTLGSLIGTFLTGYVLFGLLGSRHLLNYVAFGLVLASFLVQTKKYLYWQIVLLGLSVVAGIFSPKPLIAGFITEIDTAYSRIIIRNVNSKSREVRVFQTDRNGFQSGVYTDGSKDQPFAYIRGFSYASDLRRGGSKYLIIGGGAFTFPEYLAKKEPQAAIDTVEIDDQLPDISRQYFNFDQPKNLTIINEDGRTFLNRNHAKYDIVFLDAFSATVPPFQLFTREAAGNAYHALKDDGIMVTNIISAVEGRGNGMMRYVYSTFMAEFPHVAVYPVRAAPAESKQNLLVVAFKKPLEDALLASITAKTPEFSYMVRARISVPFDGSLVMTDDYAPVEQLAL